MHVIRRTRHQVETLTWLRAILLICAEGRKALAEVSEALRDGEVRTRCATYIAESFQESTVIDIANRLIAAGLGEEVWKAGVFASTKADLISPPEEKNPAHELLEAIHACNDAVELNALWDHVFESLIECDADDRIVVAEELIEAGDTDAIRVAHEFALKRLDSMDPRSAQYGQEVQSAENDLMQLLSDVSEDTSLMIFVDHVEDRLQLAA